MREPRTITDAEVEAAYRYLAPYMDESGDLSPAGAKYHLKQAMELADLARELDGCTCPMSVREQRRHSVGCKLWTMESDGIAPPCMGCGRPDDHNGECQR